MMLLHCETLGKRPTSVVVGRYRLLHSDCREGGLCVRQHCTGARPQCRQRCQLVGSTASVVMMTSVHVSTSM